MEGYGNDQEPIYLVIGYTGEYSAHSEWVVCAYRSKEMAEAHATGAREHAADYGRRLDGWRVMVNSTRQPYREGFHFVPFTTLVTPPRPKWHSSPFDPTGNVNDWDEPPEYEVRRVVMLAEVPQTTEAA
jgi:hypothetical protein